MTRRRNRRSPSSNALLDLARQAGLDKDDVQKALLKGIASDSPFVRRTAEKGLAVEAVKEERQPFDDTTTSVPAIHDHVTLGTTITGSSYDLKQDDLTQHLLVIGESGAGKTTLLYNIMDQLDVPFWSFDLKQDYRHLIQEHDDLLVLPWSELKFNPLKPPDGVPPRRWAQVFSEVFGHATALLSGSKNYLMQQIIDLYQLYDLFDEVTEPYPSLHELQRLHESDKINYMRKTANYRDTVLNRLQSMNQSAGTVFDCSSGYPLAELLERNVVFEFDGLGDDARNVLMEVLMAAVYEYRVAQDHRGGDLRHVFFLDEGKQVFSVYKERQDAAGLPVIDRLTAKMREFGEGLVVADQEASKLTDSIKANTDTKLLLKTGDAKQFREVVASMFLDEKQKEVSQKLSVGEAVIQTGNNEPVPVKLDNYELDKSISDEELRKRQAKHWNELSSTPRETPSTVEQQIHDGDEIEILDDPDQAIDLSDKAEKLLKDVAKHPFKSLTERYETVFSSRGKGDAPKNELVENGMVIERRIRATQAGRKPKLLQLTENGRDYVKEHDEMELNREGRGGIVHQYWQQRIKDMIEEAGWSASIEASDADVYTIMDGTELAVEVAMGNNEREVEHVEKHLDTFDVVWVACRNDDVQSGIRERLNENDLLQENVTLRSVSDFVNPDDAFAAIDA